MAALTVLPLVLIRTAGLPFDRLAQLSADWKTADTAVSVGEAQLAAATRELHAAFDVALAELTNPGLRTAVYNARKDFFHRQKLPGAAWCAARAMAGSPEISRLVQAVEACRQARRAQEEALAAYERRHEAAWLQACRALQVVAQEEDFQRALLFSSHSLLEQLPRFIEKPAAHFAKKERRTALAVLQYATRMALKTSPLSRFTTVSVQKPDAGEPPFGQSIVSPNVALLEAFYAVLLREPAFYRALPATLNPCITAPEEREYNWLFYNGEEEGFQTAAADPTLNYLVDLLLKNRRQMPFEALSGALQAVAGAEPAEAEAYLLDLLDLGFMEWVLPERGLSPDWCAGLYRFLGFLPSTPPVLQTAELLQWLRATARALPYQPVAGAAEAQRAAGGQVRAYLERHSLEAAPIPPEQLFFEDVERPAPLDIPPAELNRILEQLAACWQRQPDKPLPPHRAALFAFLETKTTPGQPLDFLRFCREYLSAEHTSPPATAQGRSPEKIGALLQVFWENGSWHAVLNGLFPGGGKMFARWQHLFSPGVQRVLRDWVDTGSGDSPAILPFPWQGYFNANFQPPPAGRILAVPGGRMQAAPGGEVFLLGQLEIVRDSRGPALRDRASGRLFELTDLGLEAFETRPPVMQLLWQLGVPYVSAEALAPEGLWQTQRGNALRFRPRYAVQNITIARASWVLEPETWKPWLAAAGAVFFRNTRRELSSLRVPRHFFARLPGEKPQYFDQDSPALLALFLKILKQGEGALSLTEALPLPPDGQGRRVSELAVEFVL